MPLVTAQQNEVLDYFIANSQATWTMTLNTLSEWRIGLSTAAPGDTGSSFAEPTVGTGGYGRIQATAATHFATPASGGTVSNSTALAFGDSSAAWSTTTNDLTHFGLFSSNTVTSPIETNLILWGALTTARQVNAAGVNLTFAIGALTFDV